MIGFDGQPLRRASRRIELGALRVGARSSGHATRQSLEIYSRIALADAQHAYNEAITSYPV